MTTTIVCARCDGFTPYVYDKQAHIDSGIMSAVERSSIVYVHRGSCGAEEAERR